MNSFNPAYIDMIAAMITKALPEGYECKYHLQNFDRTVGFAVMELPVVGAEPVWGFARQFGWVGRTEDDEGRQGPALTKDALIAFVDDMRAKIAERVQ